MGLFKFNNLHEQVKDVFQKPKLYWFIGKWSNDPCLPVWRRGPILYPFGYPYKAHIQDKIKQVRNSVNVKLYRKGDILKNGEIAKWDCSQSVYHKLPGNLHDGDYIWNREIRKKLKKFHLSWIKPEYQLPIWCSFHFWNSEVIWKTKWSSTDFRFEFPGHFTIVLFGLSFSLWSNWPSTHNSYSDWYWESILHFLYGRTPKSLRNAVYEMGRCIYWTKEDEKKTEFTFKKEFLKEKYWPEYDKIVAEYTPHNEEEYGTE